MGSSLFFLQSDNRILDLIRKGDEEALVILYNSNRKAIISFVTRNNGSYDDAEDMLQEALMVLWERVRSGRFEYASKLSTFIYATVKNMWSRQLARKRKEIPTSLRDRRSVDPDMNPSGEVSVLDELIQSEQAQLVRSALAKLGEPCKQLLLLFYWEELSMEEIAIQIGFANAESVKSKKYQCKKALEKLLRESM